MLQLPIQLTGIDLLVPQLETTDLLLRGHRLTDLAPCVAMGQQPEFYKYLGGKPMEEEDVWRRILAHQGHWAMMGYGYWAVEEKATGEFIGSVGFYDIMRNLSPAINGFPEAGWVMNPRVHGRGYASQAVRAIHVWGDAHFPNPRTVCIIDPHNEPSLRLAHKLGYQEYDRSTYRDEPIVLLERFRPTGTLGE
ncbi:GNAT family N-acetyltransferase [Hymenobacter seoulensis]